MQKDFLENIIHIRAFVMDIDGVFTNNEMLLLANGERLRKVNIKDGWALGIATRRKYLICALMEDDSMAISRWLESCGIKEIYLNVDQKIMAFEKFIIDHEIDMKEIAYLGDDINDIPAMKIAGCAVCPADACAEVKKHAHYITDAKGGEGCFREFFEVMLKAQKKWDY